VNRQIRVIVRTIGEHRVDMDNFNDYTDSISIMNLNRWCRRFGIPVPKAYWNRLWVVRDGAGAAGAGFTWFLMIGGEALVLMTLASRPITFFMLIHGIFSLTCATLGAIAHFRAMFSNPV